MLYYYPEPEQDQKRLPKRLPKRELPSHIGDEDIKGNWLVYYVEGGDHLHDFSPYKNHGTIIGGVWASTRKGWALDFGGSDYVEIPDDPSLDITSSLSILGWIYLRETGNWKGLIWKENSYYTGIQNNDNVIVMFNGTSVGEYDTVFTVGEWASGLPGMVPPSNTFIMVMWWERRASLGASMKPRTMYTSGRGLVIILTAESVKSASTRGVSQRQKLNACTNGVMFSQR